MKHTLSFDIEDWFHIVDISELEDQSKWNEFSKQSLVEKRTLQILEILNDFNTKATFFILGWIADRYPDLIQEIAEQGHEIGTHSYWHRRIYKLNREEFQRDLSRSIESITKSSGAEIRGFRAPSFSITPGSEWAFEVMKDLGLEYDASLFPAKRGHGGYKIKQGPQILDKKMFGISFPELPMSMMPVGSMNIPFSGGGYLRFWPESILKFGLNQLEKKNLPGIIYLHPRDFATGCPKASMPFHRKFKCYYNLGSTEKKLKMLLRNFEFTTCEEVLASSVFLEHRGR